MRHTLSVSLALTVLAAIALAACSPGAGITGQSLTQPAQIVGVWQTFSPHCTPGYMLIRPDGTYTWSCKRDGSDGLSGTYRFDGSNFIILNDICGAEGTYQVFAAGNDPTAKTLTFKLVKDDCAAEVSTLTTQKVTWDSALP